MDRHSASPTGRASVGRPPQAGRRAGSSAGAWGWGAAGSALLGAALVTAGQSATSADAYWTDSGTITSGTVTTWALTGVSCPNPAWGTNTTLSWSAPSGTSSTVTIALDPSSPAVTGLASWTTSLQPGSPQTTSGTQAAWGISSTNPFETAQFSGTWSLTSTAPGGAWTATRTGTWAIDFTSEFLGSTTCTTDP